ncbi:SMP-30/gluconolactonase/LRE family protein [Pseudooceanicola nanhaiensis]|uniref:SMP-30/gluconolactonase/LRE family protein n=1 Tax=Pseudooceanicola nanhaiensis TaxID=375761 RepID=UPI001CD628D8|nr:SMP-30/gluconolactonase/LRE family protein [Pseudooceanicola nanhaiensis]MCA0919852.1 SMP-30/gluconolactonase/LRE family protein [Pseudooceanicola nanhaiensis]
MTPQTTADATLYDARPCHLGEGALWHPEREQLFWFDILGHRLLSREGDRPLDWDLGECASAAGWIDRDHLLIATETGLWRLALATGDKSLLCPLEADIPATRSNDGRADPQGGFWIGTMGKAAEPGLGAIYRYHGGELRRLYPGITIPNAICFAPDGRSAYFTDTGVGRIFRVPLDAEGWPAGDPVLFVDVAAAGASPDGAVTDAEGAVWNAQWGSARVVRYLPDGTPDRIVPLAGRHASCPAFGGPGLRTLFVTSAREGIAAPDAAQGCTYALTQEIAGRPEPRVRL